MELASWLQPLWLTRGRIMEGLAWFDAALGDDAAEVEMPAARVRALADKSMLAGWIGVPNAVDLAERALNMARTLDDPALLVRALTARSCAPIWSAEADGPYFARLFISPRTVETHLTHVYSKLGLGSRLQLAQEVARHG